MSLGTHLRQRVRCLAAGVSQPGPALHRAAGHHCTVALRNGLCPSQAYQGPAMWEVCMQESAALLPAGRLAPAQQVAAPARHVRRCQSASAHGAWHLPDIFSTISSVWHEWPPSGGCSAGRGQGGTSSRQPRGGRDQGLHHCGRGAPEGCSCLSSAPRHVVSSSPSCLCRATSACQAGGIRAFATHAVSASWLLGMGDNKRLLEHDHRGCTIAKAVLRLASRYMGRGFAYFDEASILL